MTDSSSSACHFRFKQETVEFECIQYLTTMFSVDSNKTTLLSIQSRNALIVFKLQRTLFLPELFLIFVVVVGNYSK